MSAAALLLALAVLSARAEGTAESLPDSPSAVVAYNLAGSVPAGPVTKDVLRLSLAEAIERGLAHNLAVLTAIQQERFLHGERLGVENYLLPQINLSGFSSTESEDLAALGFSQTFLAKLGYPPGSVPNIIKTDFTGAQVSVGQQLFNGQAMWLYRAARAENEAAQMDTLNAHGGVVEAVGAQYLSVLAAEAEAENAEALLRADQKAFEQAHERHRAGVATGLDELRAQVQMQTQQQAAVEAEASLVKARMALNRMIGLAAEQAVDLTDAAPYADVAMLPLEQAEATAYAHRKDWLALEARLHSARLQVRATQWERAPVLSAGGYYGVMGQTESLYHGVFLVGGSLTLPLFREAQLRGEHEAAAAQLDGVRAREADLRAMIRIQLRDAQMDVNAASALVKSADSALDLARQELEDVSARFAAGVDDNLPVVRAQSAMAAAHSAHVQALYQYNVAKLELARATGVVESQYAAYLY